MENLDLHMKILLTDALLGCMMLVLTVGEFRHLADRDIRREIFAEGEPKTI